MRLTRRGSVAVGLAAVAIGLGFWFGPRSLNAVAAPLLGAVAVGAVQVWRADAPDVDLGAVSPGFPGDRREWVIEVGGGGILEVRKEWVEGLEGEPVEAVVAPPATLTAEVTLGERGVYQVSAPTLRRRDSLGLVAESVEPDAGTTVTVYPDVYRGVDRGPLADLFADEAHAERQAFDTLREYTPGDPLRHVHWKSSAKHDEFLVTEFDPSSRTETVRIAASASPGCADEMATAAGTIALLGLRAGLSVGLGLPGETVPPGSGAAHAASVLGALARADHGDLPDGPTGADDVIVEARARETLVRIGDRTLLFGRLIDGPTVRPAREVSVA